MAHGDHLEELLLLAAILLEAASSTAGDGVAAGLTDATHDHAHVSRLSDDAHALGLQHLHDGLGHLASETLLHLQSTCEHLDDADELGEAEDLAVRDVADVDLAHEGDHVVLTHGEKVNVTNNDHFISILLKDRIVDEFAKILFIALGEEGHSLCSAHGGFQHTASLGVLADVRENRRVGSGDSFELLLSSRGRFVEDIASILSEPWVPKVVGKRVQTKIK